MNKFLYITHITPEKKRSAFRQSLIDIYFFALKNQSYQSWKVIILGEEEKTEDRFYYFRIEDGSRETRFASVKKMFERPEVQSLVGEADYIIKLDDDDIISSRLLEHLKDFNGDLYYDRFHTFIDSSSGVITQQERPWIASTCVHKTKHALAAWNGEGASSVGNLLYTDHNKAWHLYYKDKNKTAAPSALPVYLRVLSPTSITSGALHGPPKVITDVSFPKYYEYLQTFGDWKPAAIKDFSAYLPMLSVAWKSFAGKPQEKLPAGVFKKNDKVFAGKLKRIFCAIFKL